MPTQAQWRSSPPYYEHLGLELDALDAGRSVIRLPFRPHYANTRGEVHGGAIASLVDASMSQAVRSTVERGAKVATITMTLNYLAPAHGELTGRGRVIKSGRTLVFAEAEISDESAAVVCRATATYRVAAPK